MHGILNTSTSRAVGKCHKWSLEIMNKRKCTLYLEKKHNYSVEDFGVCPGPGPSAKAVGCFFMTLHSSIISILVEAEGQGISVGPLLLIGNLPFSRVNNTLYHTWALFLVSAVTILIF